jgi:hypothetical protein
VWLFFKICRLEFGLGQLKFSHVLFQIPGHDQVFINDPRLSDFKQILQKNGVQAEFAGGVLVCCNGVLAITRVSDSLRLKNALEEL